MCTGTLHLTGAQRPVGRMAGLYSAVSSALRVDINEIWFRRKAFRSKTASAIKHDPISAMPPDSEIV